MPHFHTISADVAVLVIALASAPTALAQTTSRGGPSGGGPGGGNGGPTLGDPPYSCLTLMQNCNPQATQQEGCERVRVREWIDARHFRWVDRCAERMGQ